MTMTVPTSTRPARPAAEQSNAHDQRRRDVPADAETEMRIQTWTEVG